MSSALWQARAARSGSVSRRTRNFSARCARCCRPTTRSTSPRSVTSTPNRGPFCVRETSSWPELAWLLSNRVKRADPEAAAGRLARAAAAFGPDDQAPHALEGVLRDLPDGASTVRATAHHDRATLRLVNHPVTGPMFSGPQQPDFFCSTPEHLAGFGLTGPFLDEDCSLTTQAGHYYRAADNSWKPYDPSAPRPADMTTTTTSPIHGAMA